MEKPGTKDGRKSDMGNKGKDDKRKGTFIPAIFCYNSLLYSNRASFSPLNSPVSAKFMLLMQVYYLISILKLVN